MGAHICEAMELMSRQSSVVALRKIIVGCDLLFSVCKNNTIFVE